MLLQRLLQQSFSKILFREYIRNHACSYLLVVRLLNLVTPSHLTGDQVVDVFPEPTRQVESAVDETSRSAATSCRQRVNLPELFGLHVEVCDQGSSFLFRWFPTGHKELRSQGDTGGMLWQCRLAVGDSGDVQFLPRIVNNVVLQHTIRHDLFA